MNRFPKLEYEELIQGKRIWHADGRGKRPEHIAYRESYRATYQGSYTKGKLLAWDGLTSNKPGMVSNDPERGFVLTMRAGDAEAGSYTTRDIASAGHGIDYQPHFKDWEEDKTAHPNLVMPGRTVLWKSVRFDLLNLGNELLGTAGAIIQDWMGIDFETMENYGNTAMSQYTGGGFVIFNPKAAFPRMARVIAKFQRGRPFGKPIRSGLAPLNVMFARVKGYMKTSVLYIDPDIPHELACHWSLNGQEISFWCDGENVLNVRQGTWAIPIGLRTKAKVGFHKCGFHVDCWQDNGTGSTDVQGAAGHSNIDQVYTIENLSIISSDTH